MKTNGWIKAGILFLCVVALVQSLVADERIVLVNANTLRADPEMAPGAQMLSGQVHLTHAGMQMYCDSAVIFDVTNSCMARGHVKIVQGDTLTLTGDSLYYNGFSQMAEMRRNVVMTHRSQVLHTDNLNYDRTTSRGYFFDGGKLVDGKNELTANFGEYFTNTREAHFNDLVELNGPDYKLVSDTLNYDVKTKWSHVIGPSNVYSGDNRIYTEDGYYNSDLKQSRLYGRSQLFNKNRKLVADSMHYDKKTGMSHGYGHMLYEDKDNKNILVGNYGYYKETTGEAMATDMALGKDYSQSDDTLFVHADTLRLFSFNMKTDSLYRKIHAYPHVRAFRNDMQAVCDSLVFQSNTRIMTLYKDPILWNDERQILGEEINAFFNDSTLDSIYVERQALLVEKKDSTLYDQTAGNLMKVYYKDGELRACDVDGNVIVVYYPIEEDSTIVYQTYGEFAKLKTNIEKRKIKRMWAGPNPSGYYYVIGMAPHEHCFLGNFAWFDYIRPVDPDDVFNWRPKKDSEKLKWVPRREAPMQRLNNKISKKQ